MGSRWIWRSLAIPGLAWLAVFFIVAFYAIISVGLGNVTTLYEPVPHWNPLDWNVGYIWQGLKAVVPGGDTWDTFLRTIIYVFVAVVLSLAANPVCREDCPGLCPDCGVPLDELPEGHRHEQVDPRWAALSNLTREEE